MPFPGEDETGAACHKSPLEPVGMGDAGGEAPDVGFRERSALVYDLDADLKPLGSRYLGDAEAAARAAAAVANQGKA